MDKTFWVYIVTDKPYGTLYTGVTSNLQRRVYEHQNRLYEAFTRSNGLKHLVYCEEYPTAAEAIHREKCIKEWKRDWKIRLIHEQNRKWEDLAAKFNS